MWIFHADFLKASPMELGADPHQIHIQSASNYFDVNFQLPIDVSERNPHQGVTPHFLFSATGISNAMKSVGCEFQADFSHGIRIQFHVHIHRVNIP